MRVLARLEQGGRRQVDEQSAPYDGPPERVRSTLGPVGADHDLSQCVFFLAHLDTLPQLRVLRPFPNRSRGGQIETWMHCS